MAAILFLSKPHCIWGCMWHIVRDSCFCSLTMLPSFLRCFVINSYLCNCGCISGSQNECSCASTHLFVFLQVIAATDVGFTLFVLKELNGMKNVAIPYMASHTILRRSSAKQAHCSQVCNTSVARTHSDGLPLNGFQCATTLYQLKVAMVLLHGSFERLLISGVL